ncbi:glycosyltransferase family 4 protein [Candidatus Saccharibacteria bacterium]|nr:glycosyltransferase family 4 protein [Candidatus Saccharibacteria bacterium]
MKKIVIDARELRTSTGRYVERLLHYLQEVDKDPNHRYVILLKPKDMEGWEPTNKRFSKVACRYKEFTFAEQLGLAWQLYRLQPDLVHFPMVQQPILYQRAVVTTMQDLTTLRFTNPSKNRYVFRFKQWVYHWVNIFVAKKSRAILTPSEFVKDDVAKYARINSRKITVTLEAGDQVEATAEPISELEGTQFLMYVGRPTPHKNLPRLIEAFVLLQKKHKKLKLVLAGKKDSNYRRIEREVNKQGVEGVVFTDFIPDSQLRWLYENCAAYVFPSLSEGFGLPGLEAMASGAPVASSDATCLPEVLGEAAHYFNPENVEDIVRAVNDILTDKKLRAKLIKRGEQQVKLYSWKRMAEQTLTVYKDVLKEEEAS